MQSVADHICELTMQEFDFDLILYSTTLCFLVSQIMHAYLARREKKIENIKLWTFSIHNYINTYDAACMCINYR